MNFYEANLYFPTNQHLNDLRIAFQTANEVFRSNISNTLFAIIGKCSLQKNHSLGNQTISHFKLYLGFLGQLQ